MKRTFLSARRRASRQLLAKEALLGSAPYSWRMEGGSERMSISSGTLVCIR